MTTMRTGEMEGVPTYCVDERLMMMMMMAGSRRKRQRAERIAGDSTQTRQRCITGTLVSKRPSLVNSDEEMGPPALHCRKKGQASQKEKGNGTRTLASVEVGGPVCL